MATTKTTPTTTTTRRSRSRQPSAIINRVAWHILFEENDRITIEAPRSLAGADACATLLPTGGELALYLDDPEAAIAALCCRTHAPLLVSMLAFRAMFTNNAAA